MNKLKTIITTTLTAIVLATPAFAIPPEKPICDTRNCDHSSSMAATPSPELSPQVGEITLRK